VCPTQFLFGTGGRRYSWFLGKTHLPHFLRLTARALPLYRTAKVTPRVALSIPGKSSSELSMPEFALATRTWTVRAAAIAVIAAAVAPGAAAFGAGSALQLRSMSVALPRGALSASRPCMAAAGGDPAPKQGAEPRLLGSRRLHRWVKGGDKAAAARQIKDDILTSAANSQDILQASMLLLLGASLTRTRIQEVAMGMSLGGIDTNPLSEGSATGVVR